MIWTLVLLLCAADKPADTGAIAGMVVNGSHDDRPVPQAEVVLRAQSDGPWLVVAETKTNERGIFYFEKLPLGAQVLYQPGANLDEVHYPGAALRLSAARPRETVKLTVHSAQARPNPLVLRSFDGQRNVEGGTLQVAEKLVIANPGKQTYVGETRSGSAEPVTLQLAIPPQFDRTTFTKEFFGRRFTVLDDKLTTSVPWPPGERELAHTYILRQRDWHGQWQRPLDLPCSRVRVIVRTALPDEVAGNLPRAAGSPVGTVVFDSAGQTLPAGYRLQVSLGRSPWAWMQIARIVAAATLALLIAGAIVFVVRRRQRPARR